MKHKQPKTYKKTKKFAIGKQVRAEIMGEIYVSKTLETAREEGYLDLQQLVTEFAWGTVWVRDGLNRKQRSICTVSMLIALNRPQELINHFRGALSNGITPDELLELVVHASVYCGFPAALDARRQLAEVLDDVASKSIP